MDWNIQVVVEVFGIMTAYFVQTCCACVLCTVQYGSFCTVQNTRAQQDRMKYAAIISITSTTCILHSVL